MMVLLAMLVVTTREYCYKQREHGCIKWRMVVLKSVLEFSFDSGSQRSYISKRVRARLQLKSVKSEKVIIKTFGQDGDSEVK